MVHNRRLLEWTNNTLRPLFCRRPGLPKGIPSASYPVQLYRQLCQNAASVQHAWDGCQKATRCMGLKPEDTTSSQWSPTAAWHLFSEGNLAWAMPWTGVETTFCKRRGKSETDVDLTSQGSAGVADNSGPQLRAQTVHWVGNCNHQWGISVKGMLRTPWWTKKKKKLKSETGMHAFTSGR